MTPKIKLRRWKKYETPVVKMRGREIVSDEIVPVAKLTREQAIDCLCDAIDAIEDLSESVDSAATHISAWTWGHYQERRQTPKDMRPKKLKGKPT
jgi:hypothetical protein